MFPALPKPVLFIYCLCVCILDYLSKCWGLWGLLLSICQDCLGKDKSPPSFYQPKYKYTLGPLSDYVVYCRQALRYRLRNEGLCRRHSGGQTSQEELGSIGNQKGKRRERILRTKILMFSCEGDVCSKQTRRPAECWSFQRVHDVPKQTAFRMFLRQGTVLPWRNHLCQCSHSGKYWEISKRDIFKMAQLYQD